MPGRELLDKFMQSLRSALPSTWKSASWLLKLMIPISLTVALLQHWGILATRILFALVVVWGRKSLTPALSKREGANL